LKTDIKLEGKEELSRKLAEIADSINYNRMEGILYESAEEVKSALIQAAPLGPTGNLKRSPMAKKMPKSEAPVVIAGIDRKKAPHAHLVEFGTVKMSAKPFFRPTWDRLKGKVNKDIEAKTKQAVDKSVK